MGRNKKIYSLYKGEKELAFGTIDEISEQTKTKVRSLYFYKTKTYQNRGLGLKSKNKRILVECGDADE